MKYTYAAMAGVVIIGVIIAVVFYQPYGECNAMNKDLQEHQRIMEKLTPLNPLYLEMAEKYDLKKEEYEASCRPLM